MNAKHLVLAAVVTVWASAAVAAINYGHPEPVAKVETTGIPRVVVTAKKVGTEIPRILVVGRRIDAGQTVAAAN